MHDFEAETADQICAAESEVERLRERAAALEADVLRLRSEIALALACTEQAQHIAAKAEAELAAITAALDGQPLPPDAGERARRVARMARFARDYECDRCGAFNGYGIGCRSCGYMGEEEPAPEDDGLTAEDRAKGWRWIVDGNKRFLERSGFGAAFAIVDGEGWNARGARGPETGAAGQRAACEHLRRAGVL